MLTIKIHEAPLIFRLPSLNFYIFASKTKGILTVLVPGGAHEARNWSKDEVKLYLNKRKGFVKLALRFGVDLVPTFSFNEQFIFRQMPAEKGISNISLEFKYICSKLYMYIAFV